ncbi:MAG: 2-succinyl-5-enolpyruvyl-6-hydroxy-3-cyclohexene-1-carboxylic-acid synthase [Candidatus Zixiibacteriota bacterium]
MNLVTANINSLWGSLIVEELVRHGIDYFCLSPGSRSTPLVAAVALHPAVKAHVHFDERGTAYRAIGYMRASGKPAVIICTSGTAAANFFPAVVEASADSLPLIVLTADRPAELRSRGANQTINQLKLFGSYAKYFVDLPCPDVAVPAGQILSTVDQLVHAAIASPGGPVQLNCPYREPLEPTQDSFDYSAYLTSIAGWQQNAVPYSEYAGVSRGAEHQLERIAHAVKQSTRGLIIAGKLTRREDRVAVISLGQKLNWPIFADIQSGISMTGHHQIISHYDLLLASKELREQLHPDVVIQCGDRITSKRLLILIKESAPGEHVVVTDGAHRYDPVESVTCQIVSSVSRFCGALERSIPSSKESAILSLAQTASNAIAGKVDEALSHCPYMTEAAAVTSMLDHLPQSHGLFVASSMPIRLADMFAGSLGRMVQVASNRGASGIDGTVAAAVGYAEGLGQPVTLLVGDLALLHDLNSLAILKEAQVSVTIVVLNNSGGGIFGHLPIRNYPELLDKYFIARHDWQFEHAAEMFEIEHQSVRTAGELGTAYLELTTTGKSALIEVVIDRVQNQTFHDSLVQDCNALLRSREVKS